MKKQKYTVLRANKIFVITFILCFIILGLVHFLRYNSGNKTLIGEEAYFHLRISNELLEQNKIPKSDDLSYSGRDFNYPLGWPIMLLLFSFLVKKNLMLASALLPIILGLLALLIFNLILNKFKLDKGVHLLSSLILILSPPFVYLFTTSQPLAGALFFSLLGFYLFIHENKILNMLSLLAFVLISFFSILALILVILLVTFYVFVLNRQKIKLFFNFLIFYILTLLITVSSFLNNNSLQDILNYKLLFVGANFNLQNLISDFGGLYGLGLFTSITALLGLFVLWKRKYEYIQFYIFIITLVLISIFFNWAIFYLNFIITILGAVGVMYLINRKWESNIIKNLALLILILGIVFSGLSFTRQMTLLEPTSRQAEAMAFLKDKIPTRSTIFSYYDKGFWINYVDKKNVMDANFYLAPKVDERLKDSLALLKSRDIQNTFELLDRYNVNYIWIDSELKEKFFDNQDKFLYYQLKNNRKFRVVFKNFQVEIWKYERN